MNQDHSVKATVRIHFIGAHKSCNVVLPAPSREDPSLPKGQGNSCWLCLDDIRPLSILQGCQTSKGIPDSGEGKRILFSLRVTSIYSLSSCCFTESRVPPNPPQIPITQAQVLCWHLQKMSAEGTFKQRPLVYLRHSIRKDQTLDEFIVWGRLV